MSEKAILAIETSQSKCSTCVYFNDDRYNEMKNNLKNTHSEKIFEMIDSVMKSAGISFNEIEAVAFSSGPGSFTGLRIGISAAKGIAYAAGIPVIAVPTFEAFAFQISDYLPPEAEFIIANKVNMDEVYYAKFKVSDNNFIFTEKLGIITRKSLEIDTSSGISYFGNAVSKNRLSAPDALYIAKYSKRVSLPFNFDYDNLEPMYIKSFTIKEKKK